MYDALIAGSAVNSNASGDTPIQTVSTIHGTNVSAAEMAMNQRIDQIAAGNETVKNRVRPRPGSVLRVL